MTREHSPPSVAFNYIVPMSIHDVCLVEWMPKLRAYHIDEMELARFVLEAILKDLATTSLPIMGYIYEQVENEFQTQLETAHPIAANHFQEEIDKMTFVCIDACDVLREHLEPFVHAIEEDIYNRGYDPSVMHWTVNSKFGKDVIVRVSTAEGS